MEKAIPTPAGDADFGVPCRTDREKTTVQVLASAFAAQAFAKACTGNISQKAK